MIVYQVDGEGNNIHDADRLAIKQHIVGLMLKSHEQVQKQVSVTSQSSSKCVLTGMC